VCSFPRDFSNAAVDFPGTSSAKSKFFDLLSGKNIAIEKLRQADNLRASSRRVANKFDRARRFFSGSRRSASELMQSLSCRAKSRHLSIF